MEHLLQESKSHYLLQKIVNFNTFLKQKLKVIVILLDPKETQEWRVYRLPVRLRRLEPDVRELQDLQQARFPSLQGRLQAAESS